MTKRLEEAIGTWTVNLKNNSLLRQAQGILAAAHACRRKTIKGDHQALMAHVLVLQARLTSMSELTEEVRKSLQHIINDKP